METQLTIPDERLNDSEIVGKAILTMLPSRVAMNVAIDTEIIRRMVFDGEATFFSCMRINQPIHFLIGMIRMHINSLPFVACLSFISLVCLAIEVIKLNNSISLFPEYTR